jgi:glutamyl-tRNA reductase
MNSAHEGWAVIWEELDELWDEVRAKQGARDVAKMRKEAVQVAAMAMRFVLDVCDSERGQA